METKYTPESSNISKVVVQRGQPTLNVLSYDGGTALKSYPE